MSEMHFSNSSKTVRAAWVFSRSFLGVDFYCMYWEGDINPATVY